MAREEHIEEPLVLACECIRRGQALASQVLDNSGAYRTEYDVEYDFVNSLLNLEDADVEMRRELKQSTAPDEELTKDSRPEEMPWGNGSLGWFSRRGSIFGYIKPQREGQRTKSGGDSNSTEDVEKVDESPDVQLKGDPLYDEQERVKDEGYGSGDEYFFPPETLNHVVGVEATSAGLSGIRKRRRGDGARWDPGGLALLQRKETPQVDQSNVSAENWRSLETESDLDAFTMSVAPMRQDVLTCQCIFSSTVKFATLSKRSSPTASTTFTPRSSGTTYSIIIGVVPNVCALLRPVDLPGAN